MSAERHEFEAGALGPSHCRRCNEFRSAEVHQTCRQYVAHADSEYYGPSRCCSCNAPKEAHEVHRVEEAEVLPLGHPFRQCERSGQTGHPEAFCGPSGLCDECGRPAAAHEPERKVEETKPASPALCKRGHEASVITLAAGEPTYMYQVACSRRVYRGDERPCWSGPVASTPEEAKALWNGVMR